MTFNCANPMCITAQSTFFIIIVFKKIYILYDVLSNCGDVIIIL